MSIRSQIEEPQLGHQARSRLTTLSNDVRHFLAAWEADDDKLILAAVKDMRRMVACIDAHQETTDGS